MNIYIYAYNCRLFEYTLVIVIVFVVFIAFLTALFVVQLAVSLYFLFDL